MSESAPDAERLPNPAMAGMPALVQSCSVGERLTTSCGDDWSRNSTLKKAPDSEKTARLRKARKASLMSADDPNDRRGSKEGPGVSTSRGKSGKLIERGKARIDPTQKPALEHMTIDAKLSGLPPRPAMQHPTTQQAPSPSSSSSVGGSIDLALLAPTPNADGTIDAARLQAFRALQEADANGSGRLEPEEFWAAWDRVYASAEHKGVDLHEMQPHKLHALQEPWDKTAYTHLCNHDVDKDGYLGPDELWRALETLPLRLKSLHPDPDERHMRAKPRPKGRRGSLGGEIRATVMEGMGLTHQAKVVKKVDNEALATYHSLMVHDVDGDGGLEGHELLKIIGTMRAARKQSRRRGRMVKVAVLAGA